MTEALAFPLPRLNCDFGSWKWLRTWSLMVLIFVSVILAGCSFSSFVAAAEADIPVVIQMVTNITNVVAPGVSVAIQAAGGIALSSLMILCGTPAIGATKCDPTSLIGQYQATPSTTILQKIDAALSAVNANVGKMLALAKGLPANIGSAIVIAIGIALATVTSLMALIPVGHAMLAKKFGRATSLAKAINISKPETLKKAFNDAIGVQYPAAVIH